MSGKPQAPPGTHFDVSSQAGGSIANVGRDLHIGGDRRRSASIGRVVAALGLVCFFAGLILLGAAGAHVYGHTDWTAESIDPAIPDYTWPAAGLVVAGVVLNRFGRLFASH